MMENNTLENILGKVLRIPAEDIDDTTEFKNVSGWDSLRHMELIVSLENAYGVQFSFDQIAVMQDVKTVRDTLAALDGKQA
jgi:acyl carrier protein